MSIIEWIKGLSKKIDRPIMASFTYRFPHRKKIVSLKTKDNIIMDSQWKYFNLSEVEGLSKDLVYKLDRAREFYGFPIVITSGYRDPDKNDAVGGVKNSEHVTGQGVDIKASKDPASREKLAWALGCAGFRRLGVYPKHYHVGISTEHPSPAFWEGGYK